MHAASPVKEAWLWQVTDAEGPDSKDFRLETLAQRGVEWTKRRLTDQGSGTFETKLEEPGSGWTANSIELKFSEFSVFEADQAFTTAVIVRPDTLPESPEDQFAN